jgi:hypothetical protein
VTAGAIFAVRDRHGRHLGRARRHGRTAKPLSTDRRPEAGAQDAHRVPCSTHARGHTIARPAICDGPIRAGRVTICSPDRGRATQRPAAGENRAPSGVFSGGSTRR